MNGKKILFYLNLFEEERFVELEQLFNTQKNIIFYKITLNKNKRK